MIFARVEAGSKIASSNSSRLTIHRLVAHQALSKYTIFISVNFRQYKATLRDPSIHLDLAVYILVNVHVNSKP